MKTFTRPAPAPCHVQAHRPLGAAQQQAVAPQRTLHSGCGLSDRSKHIIPCAVSDPRVAAVQQSSPSKPLLGYDLLQGTLAKWCKTSSTIPVPTAVLVHGILGSRRNVTAFAKLLIKEHPSWQVLVVDLRNHGESASIATTLAAPHTVDSSADDILRLLRHLKLFPTMLVGHSFGGKVVLAMAAQFGNKLPRPVQVWVLDTLPGRVQAGTPVPGSANLQDHPRDLIAALRALPVPVRSRLHCIETLLAQGFSETIARWVATNLRPTSGRFSNAFVWTFNLDGIADMYESYESAQLWGLLADPPVGLTIDFVKAERSSFRWNEDDEARIRAGGHDIHLLKNSGHWVHTDSPEGVMAIIETSFCRRNDVESIHASYSESCDEASLGG